MTVDAEAPRSFRVQIPERNLLALDAPTARRADHWKARCAGEIRWWRDPASFSTTVEGTAEPLIVSLFMALAQGHDLTPILDRMERDD